MEDWTIIQKKKIIKVEDKTIIQRNSIGYTNHNSDSIKTASTSIGQAQSKMQIWIKMYLSIVA